MTSADFLLRILYEFAQAGQAKAEISDEMSNE
jgi:hypothetical protein